MRLYCGCMDKCTCVEEYEIPVQLQPQTTPIEIDMTDYPSLVTRGTQTDSDSLHSVSERLTQLMHINANSRDTIRLLKDLKSFLIQ